MGTIKWRPEANALTTPQSYSVRFMPQQTYGYDELAAEMARDNPLWDAAQIKAMLLARDQTIMRLLINGCQVTLQDAFSCRLSFHARLNNLDDPLPPIEEMLRVKRGCCRAGGRGGAAITLMPGTASDPAYRRIDVDVETGKVKGVF